MEISLTSWILATAAAFVIGLSKAGIKGIAVINVTFMALAFGAKESTGLVVPLLVLADIFAVIYYNRHTQWNYIFKVFNFRKLVLPRLHIGSEIYQFHKFLVFSYQFFH